MVADLEARSDAHLAGRRPGRPGAVGGVGVQAELQPQHAFVTSAQQCQGAVRGHRHDGLAKIEPVAKLSAFVLLAIDHARDDDAVIAQELAELAKQGGVLGEMLHEDLARAVEHGLGVAEAGLAIEVVGSFDLRAELRIGEQGFGQRRDAGFAGDLRLGAALLLVGQVEVFETLLGLGILDGFAQLGGKLALFFDAREHSRAALLEFAQIAEALLEVAQLGVVEGAGHFLAVAGDERHGRAFI